MPKEEIKSFTWDFYSKLIIIIFAVLQIMRWRILPQFMDMYYHLLTAWGFNQSGGYSGWDFWQYAPVGRVHIYPPFFHIILSIFLKLGIDKIILAKTFETITPILFLITSYWFFRKNYGERLGFFILFAFSSSFSFYLSLINNIPATFALIFGILAFDKLFGENIIGAIMFSLLCFYTHIGASWFIIFSIFLYGLLDAKIRKRSLIIVITAVILSIPVIIKQFAGAKFIPLSGINEKYFCEFKTIEYLLALLGAAIILSKKNKYYLILSLFLASFIFLFYPYRFFSAQGYLPVILLCAVSLDFLYDSIKNRNVFLKVPTLALALVFILIISPTISMYKNQIWEKLKYRIYFFDSAFVNMVLPQLNERIPSISLWHSDVYPATAELIRKNSVEGEIVYSTFPIVGVCLSSISERPSANALLPEVNPFKRFDPLVSSKIIIFGQDDSPELIEHLANKYNLTKIGENKMFILYKNNQCNTKINIRKASVPFWCIWIAGYVFIIMLLWGNFRRKFRRKFV